MNFTTAQQIVYGAVIMGDYASECRNRIRMDEATRTELISKRSEKIHERLYREMAPGDVAKTLRLAGQEPELHCALADALRRGDRHTATRMLAEWVDNDLWDKARVMAMKEIDGDL